MLLLRPKANQPDGGARAWGSKCSNHGGREERHGPSGRLLKTAGENDLHPARPPWAAPEIRDLPFVGSTHSHSLANEVPSRLRLDLIHTSWHRACSRSVGLSSLTD